MQQCNKRQIFHTPPDLAATNNPIESFNKQIKSVFSNYTCTSLFEFLKCLLEELIPYYSISQYEFSLERY